MNRIKRLAAPIRPKRGALEDQPIGASRCPALRPIRRRSFWSRPLTAEGIDGAPTESKRRAPIGPPIDGRDDGDDPPARQRVDEEHEAEVDEQIPPRDRTRERQTGLVHGQGRNARGAHGDRCEHQVEAMDR